MSIWEYESLASKIPKSSQLTSNEGDTELMKIYLDKFEMRELGLKHFEPQKLYLKLETQNPNQSFKDRSLAFQISYYNWKGAKKLLISSSGNAAISAAGFVAMTDMQLAIFVSNHINKAKLQKLMDIIEKYPNITLNFSDKPKSDAIKYAKVGNYINLRGSTDDTAITGFRTISYELQEQCPKADAIFVPCSSGTSTVGIYQGYKEVDMKCPAMHVCQTTKIHPIAKDYDVLFDETKTSMADAIADRVAKRSPQVHQIIEETHGFGWVISDELIETSLTFLKKKTKLKDLTPNGILSFAGLLKAIRQKRKYKNPICIISGI